MMMRKADLETEDTEDMEDMEGVIDTDRGDQSDTENAGDRSYRKSPK